MNTNFKEIELHEIILQYLSNCKRLEAELKLSVNLKEDSIFRAVTEGKIKNENTFNAGERSFYYRFHGNGITFESENLRINYSFAPISGLGVAFTDMDIKSFILQKDIKVSFPLTDIEDLFLKLEEMKIVQRVWPGYHVFVVV